MHMLTLMIEFVRKLALIMFIALALCGCKIELTGGLSEKEANEMLGQLLSHSIKASKQLDKNKTVTLYVEEAQFGDAVELLKRLGLPKKKYSNLGDIFSSDGLVASPVQEWARLNFALTQELSNTITSIPGVISAEVHVANPRKSAPFEKPPPPSASVLIVVNKDAITAQLIPQIKQLVSFSVENVEYDRVGVVISAVDPPPIQPQIEMTKFGGITLQQESLYRAIGIIAGIVVICMIIAAAITFSFLKLRKPKEEKKEEEKKEEKKEEGK